VFIINLTYNLSDGQSLFNYLKLMRLTFYV